MKRVLFAIRAVDARNFFIILSANATEQHLNYHAMAFQLKLWTFFGRRGGRISLIPPPAYAHVLAWLNLSPTRPVKIIEIYFDGAILPACLFRPHVPKHFKNS